MSNKDLTTEGLVIGDIYYNSNMPYILRVVAIPNKGGDNRTSFFCISTSSTQSYVMEAEYDRVNILAYIEDIKKGRLIKIGNIRDLFTGVFQLLKKEETHD